MSARKTASELGVTQEELDDLVWVRDALDPARPGVSLPPWLEFDMDLWASYSTAAMQVPRDDREASCGTVACLGGTMELLRAARRTGTVPGALQLRHLSEDSGPHSQALNVLFFQYDGGRPRSAVLAVRAVDEFLCGSRDPWRDAAKAGSLEAEALGVEGLSP